MNATYKIGFAALLGAAAVAGVFALDSVGAADGPQTTAQQGVPAIPSDTFGAPVSLLAAPPLPRASATLARSASSSKTATARAGTPSRST